MVSPFRAVSAALLAAIVLALPQTAQTQVRDGGIDPKNLGKGDWIYILPNAINQMGGNVPSITNLASMMASFKNQGMRYLIVKAGEGDVLYPSTAAPQLTPSVVSAAHAAGLWIFGYNRSYGLNIPAELGVADYVFTNGADGFVIDAEIEWESQNLPNNAALAVQLCSSLRSNWPNKFIAHSPFAFISGHGNFPYKEFGYYCDAAMPQDYWVQFGLTPSNTVYQMSQDWRNWQSGLTGIWTNAIKPIVPAGQGWHGSGTVTAAQITEFVTSLKSNAFPATVGGYKGVNYWRAELHPPDVWDAIRTNNIGDVPANAPVVTNIAVSTVSDNFATLVWTTDQSSDSVVDYGLAIGYGSSVTNPASLYYHTLNVTGLSPNTTYHYRVRSKNASNQQGVSADYVFTTLSVPVADIIVDDLAVAYSGAWTASSTSAHLGSEYRFSSTIASGTPATATFTPTIVTPGDYDVYVYFSTGSNRATNSPWMVSYNGGNLAVAVDQTVNNITWFKIASAKNFTAGTSGFVRLGNNAGYTGKVVISDAVKFVFVPPPPSPPSIATQPQPQTVTLGNSASFTVVASGTAPLSYQWRFEGTSISGATSSSYTKNNAQANDAGNYSVVITNSAGSTNSANAALTVLTPPSITAQPGSIDTNAGAKILFTVAATGSLPLTYQWRFNTVDINGATASSYSLTNVQPADAGNFSVVVSNQVGAVLSDDAVLTVTSPNLTPPHIDAITISPGGDPQLQVSGGPGNFAVDIATTLPDWTQLTTLTATGAVFYFTDTNGTFPSRFYRLRVLP